MLFTSSAFFWVYLPTVFLGYYLLGRRSPLCAASWLFLASLAFYGYWMPEFVLLLLGSIGWNFWVGTNIGKLDPLSGLSSNRRLARYWLILGISVDLAVLAYFKSVSYTHLDVYKRQGVTRVLAGDGGDELFGGNSRYAKQRVFNWYQHIPGLFRKGVMEPLLGTTLAGSLPLVRKASSYVEQASVPMPDRLQMYNLINRLGIEQTLTKDFLAQVNTCLLYTSRCV